MASSFSRSSHPPLFSDNASVSDGDEEEQEQEGQDATELVLPAEPEVDDNFLDNYELDAEGNDEHSLSRKMVHYCGGGDNPRTLVSVQGSDCLLCGLEPIGCVVGVEEVAIVLKRLRDG